MSFTIQDFQDLLQLLRERPDWRAQMERALLGDEFRSLPEIVRELAEAQKRTEEQIAALVERMDKFAAAQQRMETELGTVVGLLLELDYSRRAVAYLSGLALKIRVVSHEEFMAHVQDAADEGRLNEYEVKDIALLDLLARGQRRPDRQEIYLAVEISKTVRERDVFRAERRAALLQKVYPTVVPVAAGELASAGAREIAKERGVELVLNGHNVDD